MGSDNEQTELLRMIWQAIKDLGTGLGARIDETNLRLDQTNARLDQTNARLEAVRFDLDSKIEELHHALVESQMRTATAITDLAGDVQRLTTFLKEHQADAKRLASCEVRIDRLESRVAVVEGRPAH